MSRHKCNLLQEVQLGHHTIFFGSFFFYNYELFISQYFREFSFHAKFSRQLVVGHLIIDPKLELQLALFNQINFD